MAFFWRLGGAEESSFGAPPEAGGEESPAVRLQRDAFLRWALSGLAFIATLGLWAAGGVEGLAPLVAATLAYSVLAGAFAVLVRPAWIRPWMEGAFQVLDNIAIGLGVRYSGGMSSPLQILYLLPLGIEVRRRRPEAIFLNGGAACFMLALGVASAPRGAWSAGLGISSIHVAGFGLIAAGAGLSVRRLNAESALLARQIRRLETLHAIDRYLYRFKDLPDVGAVLQYVAARLKEAFDCPSCSFRFWQHGGEEGRLQPAGFEARPCPAEGCCALQLQSPWLESEPACLADMELHPGVLRACLPLLDEGRPVAVLQRVCPAGCRMTPPDLAFLENVARSVVRSVQAQRFRRSLEANLGELQKTYAMENDFIATFLKSAEGVEQAVSDVLGGIARNLEVEHANLLVWDGAAQRLWTRAGSSRPAGPPRLFLRLGEGLAGHCLLTGHPYVCPDVDKDPRFVPGAEPVRSMICVPLFDSRGGRLGVLCAHTALRARSFEERDTRLLSLYGRHLSMAIENGRLVESLERQKARLNELNTLKTRLISIASHDLRAPLQVALSYAGVLLDNDFGKLNPSQEDLVLKVLKVLRDQQHLVENLMDIAQVEIKGLAVQRRPLDLGPVFDEVAENFRQMARASRLRFEARREEGVGVNGDEMRLRQVMTNLLQNAFKFTPEGGGVTFRLKRAGLQVHLEIADTGAGIPREELGRIFQSLYQLPTEKARDRGLGLGLAICKEIVEAHDGKIWAESPGRGKGSSFHVVLPAVTPAVNRGSLPT